jgi:hypothetical protein
VKGAVDLPEEWEDIPVEVVFLSAYRPRRR